MKFKAALLSRLRRKLLHKRFISYLGFVAARSCSSCGRLGVPVDHRRSEENCHAAIVQDEEERVLEILVVIGEGHEPLLQEPVDAEEEDDPPATCVFF